MNKFNYYPYSKNKKITEDSKVLIGIGDSFCSGRGACSTEIWEKYNWDMEKMYGEGALEVQRSEYENSFVSQLSKNHMPDWIPLNLGMAGKGNRFAIKELMTNNLLGFEKAKEKIVMFVVSGFERFDFAKDLISEEHFTTQWPVYSGKPLEKDKVGYSELTLESGGSIYSEIFVLSEFILNMIELVNWCKLHNAKLLLISAFTPELNKVHFTEVLSKSVKSILGQSKLYELVNVIPWDKIIRPLGFSCITDMLMNLEGWDEQIPQYGFRNMKIETMGPNGYMTKCHHPSEKGHKLLSEIIYDYILDYDNLIDNTEIKPKLI